MIPSQSIRRQARALGWTLRRAGRKWELRRRGCPTCTLPTLMHVQFELWLIEHGAIHESRMVPA